MATPFKKSIQNVFKKMITFSFATSIVTIIIGLILLFLPELTNKVVGIIVGVSFLVSGVSVIFNYLKRDGAKIYALNIVFAILYSILGIIIILYPFTVMEFVTITLGLYLIINGVMKINHAFWLRRGSEDCWLVTLVSGILLIVFGIMVLINPFVHTLTLTKIAGVFITISGVLDFMSTFMYNKRAKEIIDIFW